LEVAVKELKAVNSRQGDLARKQVTLNQLEEEEEAWEVKLVVQEEGQSLRAEQKHVQSVVLSAQLAVQEVGR
jgi:hypothetical protein